VQLIDWQEKFEGLGVNVAGMTYDSQEILADFVNSAGLGFPLLRDVDSEHVNAFGIRNIDYEPDSRFYGIPYPGIVLISREGQVLAKFAEPGYRARPEFSDVYDRVAQSVEAGD
jgi:peroxiredoxin